MIIDKVIKRINNIFGSYDVMRMNKLALIEEIKMALAERDTDIIEMIKNKIAKHRKSFDRYNKECIIARSKKDNSQLEYSENQAIKEMNINDELKELIKQIEKT